MTNLLIETKDLYKRSQPFTPVDVLTPFKSTGKNNDIISQSFLLSPNILSTTASNKTFNYHSNKFTSNRKRPFSNT